MISQNVATFKVRFELSFVPADGDKEPLIQERLMSLSEPTKESLEEEIRIHIAGLNEFPKEWVKVKVIEFKKEA